MAALELGPQRLEFRVEGELSGPGLASTVTLPQDGTAPSDPLLLPLGTKSGSRQTFAAAGVPHPAGFEDLNTEDEVVESLCRLAKERPGIRRAVVKINEGFSGEGNGVFTYAAPRSGWWGFAALNEADFTLMTPSGEENRAVRAVGSTWFGPAQ